jgi:hypothetical protein
MRLAQTQMVFQLQVWKHKKIIPPRPRSRRGLASTRALAMRNISHLP